MFGGEGRPRTCPLPSGQGVKHRVVMRRHRGVRRPTGRALSWRELLVLTSRFCLKQGVESHLGTGTSSPTGCRVPSSIIPHKRASCATFITLKMFTFKVFLLLTGNLFQPDGDDHRSAKQKEKQVARSSSAVNSSVAHETHDLGAAPTSLCKAVLSAGSPGSSHRVPCPHT